MAFIDFTQNEIKYTCKDRESQISELTENIFFLSLALMDLDSKRLPEGKQKKLLEDLTNKGSSYEKIKEEVRRFNVDYLNSFWENLDYRIKNFPEYIEQI